MAKEKTVKNMLRHYRTKSIKITCDKPTPINLDGELMTAQHVDMYIAEQKLRFFYPKGLVWQQENTYAAV